MCFLPHLLLTLSGTENHSACCCGAFFFFFFLIGLEDVSWVGGPPEWLITRVLTLLKGCGHTQTPFKPGPSVQLSNVPLMVFTAGPLVIPSLRMHVDTKSEQPIEHPGSRVADAEIFCLLREVLLKPLQWSTTDVWVFYLLSCFVPERCEANKLWFEWVQSHTLWHTEAGSSTCSCTKPHVLKKKKKAVVPAQGGEETLIHVEKEEYKHED